MIKTMKKLKIFQAYKIFHILYAIKKLLIPLSLISLTGCDITGLIVKEGEKTVYYFTWFSIIVIFVATIIILWIIRYFAKNAK